MAGRRALAAADAGGAGVAEPPAELTPRQVVEELDRYIVGQEKAKRAVAIALRNRVRRLKLPPESAAATGRRPAFTAPPPRCDRW